MAELPSNLANVHLPAPRAARAVPNEYPTIQGTPYRIAIIGEAPGADEDQCEVPFSGTSGRLLNALLSNLGILRGACLVGNVCQIRPPGNDIQKFRWDGDEIQSGLDVLRRDIAVFNPHLCLLLGKSALKAATGEDRSIQSWRGSLFESKLIGSPFFGRKCLATIHPAAVLRMYQWMPYLRFDLQRAREEGQYPSLSLPQRHFDLNLSAAEIIERLTRLNESHEDVWISFDLEGYWDRLTRYSISTDPSTGFIVDFTEGEFGNYWSTEDEIRIWQATSALAYNPRKKKVLQNSLYDAFVLAYGHKILLRNVWWDTMLGHWELYCEFEKNLGLQASIYTKEPYWKEDRVGEELLTRKRYCCTDSAVTEEIALVQQKELKDLPAQMAHFQFNMELLNPLLYMELRGMAYDSVAAKEALAKTKEEYYALQHRLNCIAGKPLQITSYDQALNLVKSMCCKKRGIDDIKTFDQCVLSSRKDALDGCQEAVEVLKATVLIGTLPNESQLGRISSALKLHLNVESNPQICDFLYRQRRFPVQYKEKADGTPGETADVGAILELYRTSKDDVLKLILKLRSLLYWIETLSIATDADGRIRCGYNLVGTETGRLSCSSSPTGSGYNLQTVTKKLRYLFTADPEYYFFQCDLAGADGWTVAAHCARLDDRTMLDDYLCGLKPAKILALMYDKGKDINKCSREELKELCKEVDGDGWLYFGCKRVQHGTNYMMKQHTMSKQILKDSFKMTGEPIFLEPALCLSLQNLYLLRYYGIPLWQNWVADQVLRYGAITSASGHTRHFYGRIKDVGGKLNHETWKAALSEEPQANTTYACNLALHRLWHDPDNRFADGRLIVENLHQVHDALNGQFPQAYTDWSVDKIRSYFKPSIKISGMDISIPFEGKYGLSWGGKAVGEI